MWAGLGCSKSGENPQAGVRCALGGRSGLMKRGGQFPGKKVFGDSEVHPAKNNRTVVGEMLASLPVDFVACVRLFFCWRRSSAWIISSGQTSGTRYFYFSSPWLSLMPQRCEPVTYVPGFGLTACMCLPMPALCLVKGRLSGRQCIRLKLKRWKRGCSSAQ